LGLKNTEDAIDKTDFGFFPKKKNDAQRFYNEERFIMEAKQPVLRREYDGSKHNNQGYCLVIRE
jgi:hypothetical protein